MVERRTPVVELPKPMAHQVEVLEADYRYKDSMCGRRWGKTTIGLNFVVEGHGPFIERHGVRRRKYLGALHGGQILWVAPTYGILENEIWPALKQALSGAWGRDGKNEQQHQITLPAGGFVRLRSTENRDSLRGSGYDGVVIDEHASITKETWTQVIRPSLADRKGWAFFIGTPKGYNWAYDLYKAWEEDERCYVMQRPTSDNPLIGAAEIEEMSKDMSESDIAQEIYAQFVVAGGQVIKDAWWQWYQGEATGLSVVAQFIDSAFKMGSRNDYSVIATWGKSSENRYYLLDIWRDKVDEPDLLDAVYFQNAKASDKYGGTIPVVVEDAASGQGLIQNLRRPSASGGGRKALPVVAWPERDIGDKDHRRLRGMNKIARLGGVLDLIKGGVVYLPGVATIKDEQIQYIGAVAPWVRDFVSEHSAFTGDGKRDRHDDQVDTTTMALYYLKRHIGGIERTVNFRRRLDLAYV